MDGESLNNPDKPAGEYIRAPGGRVLEGLNKLLSATEYVKDRKGSKMELQVGKSDRVEIIPTLDGRGRQVTITNTSTGRKIGVEFPDINLLVGQNINAQKVLLYSLSEITKAGIINADGSLKKRTISFRLDVIQKWGEFKNAKTTKEAVRQGFKLLRGIAIEGDTDYGQIASGRTMFPEYDVGRGWAVLTLGENLDWRALLQCFRVIPTYYLSLYDTAAILLDYITFLARTNLEAPEAGEAPEPEYVFTIKLATIQRRLGLPEVDATTHPKRDIKDVIDAAVARISEAQEKNFNNEDLQLEIIDTEGLGEKNIGGFISSSQLRVTLRGEMLARLKGAAGKKELTIPIIPNPKKPKEGSIDI